MGTEERWQCGALRFCVQYCETNEGATLRIGPDARLVRLYLHLFEELYLERRLHSTMKRGIFKLSLF